MLKKRKIDELRQRLGRQRQTVLREQRAQELFINPILSYLGWSTDNEELVEIDRSTPTGKKRPDYKLLDKNKTIGLVEAKKLNVKKPGAELKPEHLEQLRGYEKKIEDKKNIVLLVLTDGNVWKFYLPAYLEGSKDFCYELKLSTDKFEDYLNNLLGRSNVLGGKSSKYLKALFHLNRIKKEYESILSEMHEQLEEIASLVKREMKKIGFGSNSKEVRKAAVEMRSKLGVSDKSKPKGGRKLKLQIEYGGEIFVENTANAVLEKVIPLLADSYGIKEVASASKEGYKHPLVMTDDEARELDKIPSYHTSEVPGYSGYWYFAGHLSNDDRKNRLEKLASELGISGFKVDLVW